MTRMRIALTTHLDAEPDLVWDAVRDPETLRYVARGLMGFRSADFPREWSMGEQIEARLTFLHVVPLWRHTLVVRHIDPSTRTIGSEERGGPVDRWDHWIEVGADGRGTSC